MKRKLNWVAILLLTGICIVGVVQAGDSGGFWIEDADEQGNPVTSLISGREIRTAKLNAMGTLNGQVMDDAFFQRMMEQVPEFDNPYERLNYFYNVDSTYLNAHTMVEGLIADRETFTAEKFYATQREQEQAYWEGNDLSQVEKEYWTDQVKQVETPYVYRHPWPGASNLGHAVKICVSVFRQSQGWRCGNRAKRGPDPLSTCDPGGGAECTPLAA